LFAAENWQVNIASGGGDQPVLAKEKWSQSSVWLAPMPSLMDNDVMPIKIVPERGHE